mmetsp:Transcript_13664/g.43145  ORF Transcript_13664/g.43145 Transcript_13664/m.43145 type:complete len:213 (-) Transcript_13664:875-1513(-)
MTDKGKVSVNKIKDSFTVGLKVAKAAVSNDEFGELDIAVAKATNTDEVTPKEKHMRTILAACARSQQETGFVIHCLQKRLQEKDWLIVLKALMVLHRLLREGPMRFADDIHKFQREHGPVHHLVNFRDACAPPSLPRPPLQPAPRELSQAPPAACLRSGVRTRTCGTTRRGCALTRCTWRSGLYVPPPNAVLRCPRPPPLSAGVRAVSGRRG